MKTWIITIFCLSTIFSYAQDGRFIRSFKISPYAEIMCAPISITEKETRTLYSGTYSLTSKDTIINNYDRPISFSFLSVIYTIRGNVYEFSENKTLGINFSPSFGFSISNYGSLSMNLPLYLTYNFGVGSTLTSEKNTGGYVGLGYEFNRINLSDYVLFNSNFGGFGGFWNSGHSIIEEVEPQNFWHQPMLISGYRWLSKKDKPWEVSFKYGWSSDPKDIPKNVKNEIGRKPQTFQIGFGWIFR